MTNKMQAVFLDRDGVINYEKGHYIASASDFEILPFALKHIAKLHSMGIRVIVITNQGGIAKGLYTREILTEIHDYLHHEIRKNGGEITEIFFCPHHHEQGKCLCRKPGSVLIEKALAKYRLNPDQTLFIGDKPRDMEAAAAAGVRGVLVDENSDWGFALDL